MRVTRILLSLLVAATFISKTAWALQGKGVIAEESEKTLKVVEGLECKLWASEPDVINPTNMDIDEKGRIWVVEGANYRGKNKMRPEGDRIVILEDTKGTGKCDKATTFYQDKSLLCPLGICVVGNKVYMSQSPTMWVFEIDETGYKPKGPPEKYLDGFSGVNHDHGLHKMMFGPDGRFYFNSGNSGMEAAEMKNAKGEVMVDSLGSNPFPKGKVWRGHDKKPGEKYKEGMAFRMNPDQTGFETLGNNFRNNYEVTSDSFGTAWQSDNDDDGNLGVRVNYVMEGGDFGYAGWGADVRRYPTQSAQEAHWHQRYPGVVPNLYGTGGGSPTGILVYEGDLLPAKYQGAVIHCNAGGQWYSYVGAFMTTPAGSGYKTVLEELVRAGDNWWKPSDLCVGTDGAVFIADWYDGQSGGHGMQDDVPGKQQGRIYRLAPVGNKPAVPALDLTNVAGQINALCSPNLSTRYLGYTKLTTGGAPAIEALKKLYTSSPKQAHRARALWALARTDAAKDAIAEGLKDSTPEIRVVAIRAARMLKQDMVAIANQLMGDKDYQVLRELALAMQYEPNERAIPVLVSLADHIDPIMPESPAYDPGNKKQSKDQIAEFEKERQERVKNKWFIEAVGIGANGREKEVLEAWTKDGKNKDEKLAEVMNWRMNRIIPENTKAPEKPKVPKKDTK